MKKLKKVEKVRWFLYGLCLFLSFCMPVAIASAETNLKCTYDGKTFYYSGKLVKYTLNGTAIDLDNTPGIIMGDYAMGSYVDVFQKGLGAKCSYNSTTKEIKITKYNKTIKLKLNSKTAYIDGKKTTAPIAPKKVKYNAQNVTKILVPTRFVAENLDYKYVWDSVKETAAITNTWGEYYIDGTWTKYIGTQAKSTFKGKSVDVSSMPGVILDGTTLVQAKKVFSTTIGLKYEYNQAKKTATLKNDKTTVIFKLGTKEALINNVTKKLDTAARIIKNKKNGKSYVMIPASFTAKAFGYQYNWNKSIKTSEISEKSDGNGNIDGSLEDCSIYFKKPKPVTEASITDSDLYLQKQFTITIPGDYVAFYKENPLVVNSSVVTKTKVSLTSAGNTKITVTTSKIQAYKITYKDEYVLVQVANPDKIYSNIVVLDPGHGDQDPGAVSGGYNEKDLNYKILYTYAKQYFNGKTSKIKAYWTRIDDTFVTLSDRAAFAKSVNADIFISLHMNSATASANGTEVYYSTKNNAKAESGLTSEKLASYFQTNIVNELDMNSRGVKTAAFTVINSNTVPAILIELGFISNASDRKKLTDTSFQKEAAKLFYDLTNDIFEKYPTGR